MHATSEKFKLCCDPTVKPPALPVIPKGIPLALREREQWVCWAYQWRADRKGGGKWTKPPLDARSGRPAKSTDPSTWCTFREALAYHRSHQETAGVGYVFAADDPFCGVDLDDSLDTATGQVLAWARPLVLVLNSYTEISPSGTGLKIWVRAGLPADSKHKRAYEGGEVELYDRERFFCATGHRLEVLP
jgi:primase-polymerase (primpol)-like protein